MHTSYPNLSNAQTSRYRKLQQRKYRDREGLFIAEGLRTVEQIVRGGNLEVVCVLVLEGVFHEYEFLSSVRDVFVADKDQFAALCDTEHSQGIIAIVSIPTDVTPLSLSKITHGLILATDSIQDPGNLGSLYRSASWFGVDALILGKGSVDIYNTKTVRSTAGALGSVPTLSGFEMAAVLDEMMMTGWGVYLLDAGDGAISLSEVTPAAKSILVVGNEGNGISRQLYHDDRFMRVIIPGNADQVESLNAAISGSIALYEFATSRR